MKQATLPATGGPKRLFLIDGYSNIFRAYYAIRNLSTTTGEPTNAVFGFIQILKKLLREEDPEYVGVALDVSRKTVRSEKFPDYKANRAPMPEDLRPQVPWIRKVLAAYRIPVQELPNYEADDVLGTLAAKAVEQGFQVTLVSADKDLFQLVGPQVSMYHTGRNKLYDPALVEEDFGAPPERVADVLALMGDASDNVPGVPGIGEKGAKKLISEFGSLEELLERAEEVKRKSYREGLTEHRDMAELSKDLVTIHRDLDVPFEPQALRRDEPDVEALRAVFQELELHSLVEELGREAASEPCEPAVEVATATAWHEALGALAAGRLTAAVIGETEPLGLAVGPPEAGGPAWLADFRRPGLRQAVVETLAGWLADPERELLGHDLKEVLRLVPEGRLARCRLADLMLVSYVLQPAGRHELAEMAFQRAQHVAISAEEAGWAKKETPPEGSEGLLAYAGERLELVRRLAPEMEEELASQADGESGNEGDSGLAGVYERIEEPLVKVLVGLEEEGVLLDCEFLSEMSDELAKDIHALEGEIYDLAGEKLNINSPQQLGVILFEKLGYPVLRRTQKTKNYATGAEVLEELASRGYPLPERILRYREIAKLKSTYVDALLALVGSDGRLHTRFNQAVAATGRLSSANPNLQNIPVRTELGQRIRKAFTAAEGKRLLVADYSQIELRVLAHIAQEKALLESFRRGEDVHRSTAATVFEVASDLVTSEQRRAAKTINFGIIYGISAFGLARNLGIARKRAQELIEGYLERYPGVRRYMDSTLAAAEKEGKVTTLYGRVRWLPELSSRNRAVRENAKRMAINARIQGTAADLMKLAMIAVDRELRAGGFESRLLLTVHDELVLEVPEAELDAVAALVKREMEGVAELDVPLVVDLGSGKSWYEAK